MDSSRDKGYKLFFELTGGGTRQFRAMSTLEHPVRQPDICLIHQPDPGIYLNYTVSLLFEMNLQYVCF